MAIHLSPLRYPGGKTKFSGLLSDIIKLNQPIDVYVEPYAGGAGAALSLLYNHKVDKIILNDVDTHIFTFWKLVFEDTEALVEKINKVEPTIDNFYYYKKIYSENNNKISELDRGFSAFFINRTARSGILKGGPIGGHEQKSKWTIDCRYNKTDLISRINVISKFKNKIELYNKDAIKLMNHLIEENKISKEKTLFYLDPPYFAKGKELYKRNYETYDHAKLNHYLKQLVGIKWVLSYDDVSFIRDIYQDIAFNGLKVNHFASKAKVGKELLIFSDDCRSIASRKLTV